MCGIVGYIGKKDVASVLLNGLKKLEYRGYDSAGVAILKDKKISVVKTKGRLAALEEKLKTEKPDGCVGIGHTRWATHGEPSDVNSHPHISNNGKIAVVHNGIIENYIKLKDFLMGKGFKFRSETDTEVIAHLIEYNYKGDLLKAVMNTMNDVEGAYALGVVCTDYPDRFIAARKDSPLIVGIGENENFIASDIPAILEYTRDIYILEDKEIACITADCIEIYNLLGERVKREVLHVDWDVSSAEKGGYEHFMMKEICEEPAVIKATISPRIQDSSIVLEKLNISDEMIKNCEKINIIACGTAYHAGVIGKYAIEKLARIPVEVEVASEFRYRDPMINDRQLTIVISQSGETLDTLMAMREAKRRGSLTIGIVNVVGSSIAREADNIIYTWAGPEIAVASTKAYNTQLSAVYLLALYLAKARGKIDDETYKDLLQQLQDLPGQAESVLKEREAIQKFAYQHFNARSVFFIGRNMDYALSMEGSLKLKEISYIHSEAYAGGELKHGTIALIEDGTLVICPLTQDYLFEKMINNIKEVKARGAVVLAITMQKNEQEVRKVADEVITIPDMNPLFAPVVAVTPLQLFAYYVSVMKGNDVDKPRNLAKSVTVE